MQVVEPPSIKDKTPAAKAGPPCKKLSRCSTWCRIKANGSTNQKAHGNSPTTAVLMIAHHFRYSTARELDSQATPAALTAGLQLATLWPSHASPVSTAIGSCDQTGLGGDVGLRAWKDARDASTSPSFEANRWGGGIDGCQRRLLWQRRLSYIHSCSNGRHLGFLYIL